jgi:hypothetical protein
MRNPAVVPRLPAVAMDVDLKGNRVIDWGNNVIVHNDQAVGERDEVACLLVSRERSEDGDSVIAGKNRRAQTWPALKDGARIVVCLADCSSGGQGVVQLAGEFLALVVADHIWPGDQ